MSTDKKINEVNKIECKDPNELLVNKVVKQEDLNIYVNLSVRTKERLNTNSEGSGSIEVINSGDFYYKNYDKSNEYNDGPYLSTSYVDISFTDTKLGAVRNRELFGVDSIDISFDAQLFPVVTMQFTYIRGHFLTQMNDKFVSNKIIEEAEKKLGNKTIEQKEIKNLINLINSNNATATSKIFFESLFQFPYPIFTLTVKGYYGPTVSFNLSVSDFKSRFDSTTGNFKITVSFIGNLYGCLSEIPTSYVLTSPYFDNKLLWNSESKNFKTGGEDEIPDIVTFLDRYNKLINKKSDDNDLNLERKNIKAYSNTLKKKNAYEKLKVVLSEYNDRLNKNEGLKLRTHRNNNKGKNDVFENDDFYLTESIGEREKINVINVLSEYSNYINSELKDNIDKIVKRNERDSIYSFYFHVINGQYNFVRKGIVNDNRLSIDTIKNRIEENYNFVNNYNEENIFLKFKSNGNIKSYFTRLDFKNILIENKRSRGVATEQKNIDFIKSFSVYENGRDKTTLIKSNNSYDISFLYHYEDTIKYVKEIENEIDKINKQLKVLKQDADSDIKQICKSVLKFDPTMKNIFHMIFAHFDILVKQINQNVVSKVDNKIKIENRGWSNYYFNGYLTDVVDPYDIVPPFPLVAERNSNNNNNEVKQIFPKVGNFKNEPEIKFVEDLVDNLQHFSFEINDVFKSINTVEGENISNSDWYPQSPSDIIYGENPYNIAFDGNRIDDHRVIENIIKIFAVRLRNNMLLGSVENTDFISNEILNICSSSPNKMNNSIIKKLRDYFKGYLIEYLEKLNVYSNKNNFEINGSIKRGCVNKNVFNGLLYSGSMLGYNKVIVENSFSSSAQDDNSNVYTNDDDKNDYRNTIFHIPNEKIERYRDKLNSIGVENEELCDFDKEIINNGYRFSNYNKRDYEYLVNAGANTTINMEKIDLYKNETYFIKFNEENAKEGHYRAIQFYLDNRTIENKCGRGKNKDGGFIQYKKLNVLINNPQKTTICRISLFDILKTGCFLYCKENGLNGKEKSGVDTFYYHTIKTWNGRDGQNVINMPNKYKNFFLETFEKWIDVNNNDTIELFGERVYSYNHYYDNVNSDGKRIKPKETSFNSGLLSCDPFTKTIYIGVVDENYHIQKEKRCYKPHKETTNAILNKNTLFTHIDNKLVENGGTYEETLKEIEIKNEATNEQKTNVYYSLKNFYDKWLCGETDDDLKKYNINKENNIFQNINFLDTHLNDISNSLYPNLKGVVDLLEKHLINPSSSLIELLSEIAQISDCLFLTLPTPLRKLKNDKDIEKLFSTGLWGNESVENNSFVVMRSGEMSHHLSDINYNFMNDGLDLVNNYGFDGVINPSLGVGAAFEIKYGNMYQNYFKSIDVNMDNPTMTDESIANLLNLSQAGKDGVVSRVNTMKNSLFPVYANRSYNCSVNMMGDMGIMPLMYFQLSNVPMFRGAYLITNVKHRITPQDFTTTFTGTRVSKYTPPYSLTPIVLENLLDKYGEDANYSVSKEKYNIIEITNEIKKISEFLDVLYKNKLNGKQYNINGDVGNKRETLASLNSNYLRIIGDDEKNTEEIRNGIFKTNDKGGCEDNIINLLYDIYKCICEYNELPKGENEKPIHIFITSSRRNGSGKSQHNIGHAIDIQGSYNGKYCDNDATLKLFALVHTYRDKICQLIWENNSNDISCDKPRIIHFSTQSPRVKKCIIQGYVKNGKTRTEDDKKESKLFKYIVNEYKYE